jgi:hypothetical protein
LSPQVLVIDGDALRNRGQRDLASFLDVTDLGALADKYISIVPIIAGTKTHIGRLVDPNQPMCQLKHVISERDDDTIGCISDITLV